MLLRYLKGLPDPVVPYDMYERFTQPLGRLAEVESPDEPEKQALLEYQTLVAEMPPLNRQLLLYLLDMLAVFIELSDENLMTSQRLVSAFHPSILTAPLATMSTDDHLQAQAVVMFLIINQDHFVLGMQGQPVGGKMENSNDNE